MAMQAVGPYIRGLRVAEGLTQEEAAQRIRVSSKSIERWEAGNTEPSFSTLSAYVKALNGSVMRLVSLLLSDVEQETIAQIVAVAALAAHEDETPEEASRINRLLDFLEAGVPPDEAARRVRSSQ